MRWCVYNILTLNLYPVEFHIFTFCCCFVVFSILQMYAIITTIHRFQNIESFTCWCCFSVDYCGDNINATIAKQRPFESIVIEICRYICIIWKCKQSAFNMKCFIVVIPFEKAFAFALNFKWIITIGLNHCWKQMS